MKKLISRKIVLLLLFAVYSTCAYTQNKKIYYDEQIHLGYLIDSSDIKYKPAIMQK